MSIGTFSRATLVSIKALRSYHEHGLLVPASIDPDTGYRSYRVSQLGDATIIKRLRDVDVPLRSVHEVLHARDPEITRRVINQHAIEMQRRLAGMEQIVATLHESLERPELHTPIHVRVDEATHALRIEGTVHADDYQVFFDDAFPRLFAAASATNATITCVGGGSARYPSTVETDVEPVEAYIAIDEPVAIPESVLSTGVRLAMIPAAECAVATHVGGFDSIADTYRQLGAWVARNATTADQPVREHYVVSIDPNSQQLLEPDQLRTEICWPVVPGSTHSESSDSSPDEPPGSSPLEPRGSESEMT